MSASFSTQIPGLELLLARGYIVAATDYPGLGTASPHPYLVGVSEGRAVLDSVRAANRIPEAAAAARFAVWGHSQGGHAALFAGQLAPSYAPELSLAGIAAAAPATNLAVLLSDDLDSKAGKVMTAFAMWSWNRVYDAPLSPLLDRHAASAIDRIAADCLEGPLEGLVMLAREWLIDHDFLHGDLTTTEPWKTLLAQNTPDATSLGKPLFIAQGSADSLVLPQVTASFAESACSSGIPVTFHLGKGLDHLKIATESAPQATEWISARLSGASPGDDCDKLPELRPDGTE